MVRISHVMGYIVIILCFSFVLVTADRLPNQTPENQLFSIDSVIEVTGMVDDTNSLKWVVTSPGAIPTGTLGYTQAIADFSYKDSIFSNGGKISENKNFGFDSQDKAKNLYNLETEKVLTYTSTEGAHLVGEEEYTLDIAGNWANVADNVRCVFSTSHGIGVPAFCNIVSAKSNLININSAQVSTKGILRAVTNTLNAPTEMSYRIAVSPDVNSGSRFADGTVSTVFAGSVMEARNGNDYNATDPIWNKTSSERTWKDSTSVTGGIKTFQKVFGDPSYQSGILDPVNAPELGGPGTIIVIAADSGSTSISNYLAFILTGPASRTGRPPMTFTGMPPGFYTATPTEGGTGVMVPRYESASGTLEAGGTLTLNIQHND